MKGENEMKKLYEIKMTNTGGRAGEVHDDAGKFSMKIVPAGVEVDNATNPEQLFAAGYSACFNSALSLVLKQAGIKGASTVSATVSLLERAPFDYIIGVQIEGHIDGLSIEEAQSMLEKAHTVCPYSKATRGNIEVMVQAV